MESVSVHWQHPSALIRVSAHAVRHETSLLALSSTAADAEQSDVAQHDLPEPNAAQFIT